MFYLEEIDNSKLPIFYEFLISKCDKVSFKRMYQRGSIEDLNSKDPNYYEIGFIKREEFSCLQEKMKKDLYDSFITNYDMNQEIEEYLLSAFQEELDLFSWDINYNTQIRNSKDLSFKCESEEYLGNEITRSSYDTIGSFQEICYFKIGKSIVHYLDTQINCGQSQFYISKIYL